MKTAIEKAIEDIEGYRSFSDTIEIRFVCALLRNMYLGEEKRQIIDAVEDCNYGNGAEYYNETYREQLKSK